MEEHKFCLSEGECNEKISINFFDGQEFSLALKVLVNANTPVIFRLPYSGIKTYRTAATFMFTVYRAIKILTCDYVYSQ